MKSCGGGDCRRREAGPHRLNQHIGYGALVALLSNTGRGREIERQGGSKVGEQEGGREREEGERKRRETSQSAQV